MDNLPHPHYHYTTTTRRHRPARLPTPFTPFTRAMPLQHTLPHQFIGWVSISSFC